MGDCWHRLLRELLATLVWGNTPPHSPAPVTHKHMGLTLERADEYRFVFSVRAQFPLHYQLFKHFAADLPLESNAEETFSLSSKLSDDNGHTTSDFLSRLVRINSNRKVYNPAATNRYSQLTTTNGARRSKSQNSVTWK